MVISSGFRMPRGGEVLRKRPRQGSNVRLQISPSLQRSDSSPSARVQDQLEGVVDLLYIIGVARNVILEETTSVVCKFVIIAVRKAILGLISLFSVRC